MLVADLCLQRIELPQLWPRPLHQLAESLRHLARHLLDRVQGLLSTPLAAAGHSGLQYNNIICSNIINDKISESRVASAGRHWTGLRPAPCQTRVHLMLAVNPRRARNEPLPLRGFHNHREESVLTKTPGPYDLCIISNQISCVLIMRNAHLA